MLIPTHRPSLSEPAKEAVPDEEAVPSSTPAPSPLLTIPQVVRHLRLSRSQIYRLIATEGLPVIHFGRAVRVDPSALQDWLNQRARS